ncbi:Origin recognition complex subunit 5, partial [Coemansia nantahalensis]
GVGGMDVAARLGRQFPGRREQIDQLLALLGGADDPAPSCVFVYGPSATGKTSVVRALFAELSAEGRRHAYVNSVECFAPRLLFERVLNAWAGHTPSAENQYANYARCDSVVDFVNAARELLQGSEQAAHYIVVDQAERLRDR